MRGRTIKLTEQPAQSTNGTSSIKWFRADEIRVDPDTQRQLRPAWVKWLATHWDDDYVGLLHISLRDGVPYVTDGQHRVFAARLRGEYDRMFECRVYRDLEKSDEARLFNGLNTTKSVRAYDTFAVRLNYDADAQAIDRMVRSVGLKISDQSKDGNISAVKALENVYFGRLFRSKEATPEALQETLRTLTEAWGTARDAVVGPMIEGIGAVHLRYGDLIDETNLVRKLAKYDGGPLRVLGNAKIRRELVKSTIWRAVAEVVVDAYNKGRRSSQLPTWR